MEVEAQVGQHPTLFFNVSLILGLETLFCTPLDIAHTVSRPPPEPTPASPPPDSFFPNQTSLGTS